MESNHPLFKLNRLARLEYQSLTTDLSKLTIPIIQISLKFPTQEVQSSQIFCIPRSQHKGQFQWNFWIQPHPTTHFNKPNFKTLPTELSTWKNRNFFNNSPFKSNNENTIKTISLQKKRPNHPNIQMPNSIQIASP